MEERRAIDVLHAKEIQEVYTAQASDRMRDVINLMKKLDISQLPVVENGSVIGMVTEVELLNHMLFSTHTHTPDETIAEMIQTDFTTINVETPMETLMSVFAMARVAVVTDGDELAGIITKIDLLDYLAGQVK